MTQTHLRKHNNFTKTWCLMGLSAAWKHKDVSQSAKTFQRAKHSLKGKWGLPGYTPHTTPQNLSCPFFFFFFFYMFHEPLKHTWKDYGWSLEKYTIETENCTGTFTRDWVVPTFIWNIVFSKISVFSDVFSPSEPRYIKQSISLLGWVKQKSLCKQLHWN